ncbi:MAG: O-antigen ligase family protein [Paludibacteraceae bacterium]|nr:O-antigen ligase family protein [Paludibacteraceae bacterium]
MYKQTVDILQKINYFAFFLLLLSLPYPRQLISVTWLIWIISFYVEGLVSGRFFCRPAGLNNKKQLFPFIGLVIWAAWNLLSSLWALDSYLSITGMSKMIPYILTLPVALYGLNEQYNTKTCLKVLIISCLISILVYSFTFYWLQNSQLAVNKFYSGKIENFPFLSVNNFTLHIKHHFYYGFVMCMGIIALFSLRKHYETRYGRFLTYTCMCAILALLIIGIIWSGSRQTLVSVVALLSVALTRLISNRKLRHTVGVLILAVSLCLAFVLITKHPNSKALITPSEWLENPISKKNTPVDVRTNIWRIALSNAKEYSLYGVGYNNSQAYLVEKYKEADLKEFYTRKFGSHNQFLTVWIEIGLLAMILFTAIWLLLPYGYKKTGLYFAIIILLGMTTEQCASGLIEGVINICVSLVLLKLIYNDKENDKYLKTKQI